MEKALTTLIVMLGLCYIATELSGGLRSEPSPALQQQPLQPQRPTQGAAIFPPGGNTADSNGQMIAVTGTDLTGTSILYLIDTVHQQLAVYQAQGGSKGSRRIVLVGARRIDYDLQMLGYNDESEYTWRDLDAEFTRREAREKKKARKSTKGSMDLGADAGTKGKGEG